MGMGSQEILFVIMKRLPKQSCYYFIRCIQTEEIFKQEIV